MCTSTSILPLRRTHPLAGAKHIISIMARSQRLHPRPNTFAQTRLAIARFSLATLRRTIHTDKLIRHNRNESKKMNEPGRCLSTNPKASGQQVKSKTLL